MTFYLFIYFQIDRSLKSGFFEVNMKLVARTVRTTKTYVIYYSY